MRNRTTIRVGNGEIDIAHGPVRWSGSTRISTAEIAQLTTKEIEKYNSDGPNSTTYQLFAVTRDGREERLLSGLESEKEIRLLEELIARYLRIGTLPMQQVYAR